LHIPAIFRGLGGKFSRYLKKILIYFTISLSSPNQERHKRRIRLHLRRSTRRFKRVQLTEIFLLRLPSESYKTSYQTTKHRERITKRCK